MISESMTRILVIEPSKMLQQALAIALSIEYQVQFMDSFPDPVALTAVEAVIVDAAMLRDRNGLTAREVRAAQGWKVPTVWIDGTAALPAPVRKNLVQLKPPVRKDELHKALADCLGVAAGSKQKPNAAAVPTETPAKSRAKKSKEAIATGPSAEAFIELLEVVEVEQEQDRS
jgi:DNA-binding NtrC family response regulator